MFHVVLVFFLSATWPLLVASLQCYGCPNRFVLNYTVTSDTLPSFAECKLATATQCSITVAWYRNTPETVIIVDHYSNPVTNDSLHDFILAVAQLQLAPNNVTGLEQHDLQYQCTTSDGCNDQTTLKRLLDSLVLEDKFTQELSLLIQNVPSFNNDSATTCFRSSNSTGFCASNDFNVCQRCQIFVDQSPSSTRKICASCPNDPKGVNLVIRESLFALNNRSQVKDRVELK